ncbi:MAG: DUF4112 domain-containing protein [bacterium]|nr:DUF4112 domain-containing protein [bacterium]
MSDEPPPSNEVSLSPLQPPPWTVRWTNLLDSAVRIPFTRITFGLDVILGLVPIVGDFAGLMCGVPILVVAVRRRRPFGVILAMLANALLDAVVGSIPLLGNLFDLFWKAHQKNLQLLQEPGSLALVLREAWWKLAGLIAVVALLLILAVYLVVVFLWWYQRFVSGWGVTGIS